MRPLADRALGGFAWLAAGNGARAVLKLAVLAILGRLLAPADFGLLAAAGVVIWFSLIFSSVGVGPALVQRAEIERRHLATALTSSLLLGVLLAGVIALLAPAIAALFGLERLTPVLRALALVFPIAAVSTVAESLLQRDLRFAAIARSELISYALGYGVAGVGLAAMGYGVWSLVGAELAKTTTKSALLMRSTPGAGRAGFERRAFLELLRFGSRYTLAGFGTYIAMQGSNFVVARFLGAGALGLFGRAHELMLVPAQALGMILHKVLFPTLAQVQDQPDRLRPGYLRITALVALLVMPTSAATLVLAPEIIRTLLGPGWAGAVLPLQILASGMYLRVGYMTGLSLANATGAVGEAAWRNGVYAALVVGGALIGQAWGLAGVATAMVFAITIQFAQVFHMVRRIAAVSWPQFAAAHVPALALTGPVLLTAWAAASVLRSLGAPAPLTLLAACALVAAVTLLLVRRFPGALLGADGLWLAGMLCRTAPPQLRPLARWAVASIAGPDAGVLPTRP